MSNFDAGAGKGADRPEKTGKKRSGRPLPGQGGPPADAGNGAFYGVFSVKKASNLCFCSLDADVQRRLKMQRHSEAVTDVTAVGIRI